MNTIKNINDRWGEAVEFTGATEYEAVDSMESAIADSFGECFLLIEGTDYEVVSQ